jgi:GH18 family chitinase
MINQSRYFTIIFLFISSITASAQSRVIGYVPMGRQPVDFSKISFSKITHLNIAFLNPDSTGKMVLPENFDSLVNAAHQFNVKVLASIGGGSPNLHYGNLLEEMNRAALVQQIVEISVNHKLDGIDVDLENDAIDKNYEKLVRDLAAKLKPLGKLLTAALATWNAEKISDAALKEFDFVNIMSYDQTGPWTPDKPGPHSTYEKAVEDLKYWRSNRKLGKEKINLGVPFYGYCFGTQYGESMSYRDIIHTFPGAENRDMVLPSTGGAIYYNGSSTIKNKTSLAIKEAGGVMIWQLLQDDWGDSSLLGMIHDIVHLKK